MERAGHTAANGVTPLSLALLLDSLSATRALLECGATISPDRAPLRFLGSPDTDPDLRRLLRRATRTEIHEAAASGDTHEVARLISDGADLESRNELRETALLTAVRTSQEACVRLLVASGARLDAASGLGRAALHVAAMRGDAAMTRALLELGVDPESPDERGVVPLYLAARESHHDVVAVLLAAGAKLHLVEAILLCADSVVARYLDEGVPVDQSNTAGVTPLMAAAAGGSLELIREFVRCGADPSHTEVDSLSPLCRAINREDFETVQLLLELGANPNVQDDCLTPLASAIIGDCPDLVRLLLNHGADPNLEAFDDPPLALAVSHNAHVSARMLLEAGADPNAKASIYGSVLHAALREASLELLELLLANGSDPDQEDGAGRTPLGIAEAEGLAETAALLRRYGAAVSKSTPPLRPISEARVLRLAAPLEFLLEYRRLLPPDPPCLPELFEAFMRPALTEARTAAELIHEAVAARDGRFREVLSMLNRLSTAPGPASSEHTTPAR